LCPKAGLAREHVINLEGERVVFTAQDKVGCVVATRPGLAAAETLGPTLQRFVIHKPASLGGRRRRFKIARADENTPRMMAALRAHKDTTYVAPLYTMRGRTVAIIPEIAVRLKPAHGRDQLDAMCKANGFTVIRKLDFTDRDYLLAPPAKDASDVFDAVDKLDRLPLIDRAVPNIAFRPKLHGPRYPNDSYFPNQWHLNNTGQTGGTVDADIDAPEAWEITTGATDIVVAVIDDGVDVDHPDLVDNLVPGYDFVDDDNDPDASIFWDDAHGTACAGLIAARGDNAAGVTGVAWNCKIMPIRIIDGFAFITDADIATAFRWAATNGADIMNNSWGGLSAMPLVHDAIQDVTAPDGIGRGGLGCVVLGSSGNEGGPVLWPGAYDEVIAVGATDEFDVVWSYSGSGSQLDVTAPSGDLDGDGLMWTTDLAGTPGYGNRNPAILDYTDLMGGTSGACPVAAGVAALILSVAPDLTGAQVKDILQSSADDLGAPGRDNFYGHGRVNARTALCMATGLDHFEWSTPSGQPIPTQAVDGPFDVKITAKDVQGGTATGFAGTVDLSARIGRPPGRVSIGSGMSVWFIPMATLYEDARTQVIYLAGEIGGPGTLDALSLSVDTIPSETLNNWTIRMKHTSLSAYPHGPAWEGSDWTTVYQNDDAITSTGWVTFVFSTPFEYDGAQNLMIDFSFNNLPWEYEYDGFCFASTDGTVRTIYFRSDSQDGDPLTWTGALPVPETDTYFPDIMLSTAGGTPVWVSPAESGNFVGGIWTGQITVHEPATGMRLGADSGIGYSGDSNAFDVLPLTHTLNVQSTPTGVLITGNKPGTTSYNAICQDQEVVTLTAPATAPGPEMDHNFIRWVVDGVDQAGDRTIELTMDSDHTALALYYHWPITGDATGDCKVNILDMLFIRDKLTSDPTTGDNWKADVTQDGDINVLDMLHVRNHLNNTCE